MSTRALLIFESDGERFAVYKHCDGYPSHITPLINAAKQYAWPLPRWEAGDFAAAFVRAAKEGGGNVYLADPETDWDVAYTYTVTENGIKIDKGQYA